MRGAALMLHSLRRVSGLVWIIGLLLAAFQMLLVLVAGSLARSGSFDQVAALVPSFVRQLLGPSLLGLMSFGGIICVGYFHPIVMGSLLGLAIALATEPASEIESRFIDLILSRPLARHWIITRSIVVLVGSVLLVLILMILGTWTGLAWLAPEGAAGPPPRLLRLLVLNLGALVLCWGALALLAAALSRRRAIAGGLSGLAALAAYLLDYVARVWKPAGWAALFSPFHYYNPFDLVIGNEIPRHHLWVLAGTATAACALAYAVYQRRDL